MLAKDSQTPRLFRTHALSLTFFASKLAPTGGSALRPRHEVLLRRATGDQAGYVVQLLRILVDKAEGQLQPVAVGLGLVGDDGVQVAVEARDFDVVALLKAKIPGASQAQFEELSKKAKEGCPVSKVLKATITLDATLVN